MKKTLAERNKEIWGKRLEEMEKIYKRITIIGGKLFEKGVIKSDNDWSWFSYNAIPELKKRTGNVDLFKYVSFHVLIGSTPIPESEKDFDLPDNKIVNFAKELLKKLELAEISGKFEL